MNLTTTLTILDLSRIYNHNRSVICTWHTQYGMPYTSFDGNAARISIKDLLFFFDTRIRTSNAPKRWIDNKNTLLAYIKNQNTTPTMTSIVNSQSSIVNKYDPCRPFKAGDVARVVERFGRIDATHALGALVTVTKDECGFTFIHVKHETGAEGLIPWLYLELVTPVEELEPYKLIDSPNTYNIVRDSAMVMTIHKKSHPNAKAAAEAERDRLNAEYRKEQK